MLMSIFECRKDAVSIRSLMVDDDMEFSEIKPEDLMRAIDRDAIKADDTAKAEIMARILAKLSSADIAGFLSIDKSITSPYIDIVRILKTSDFKRGEKVVKAGPYSYSYFAGIIKLYIDGTTPDKIFIISYLSPNRPVILSYS